MSDRIVITSFVHGVLTSGSVKKDADDVAVFATVLRNKPVKDAVVRAELDRGVAATATAGDIVETLRSLALPIGAAWTAADAAVAKEPAARRQLAALCP